jgi:hypothetical protein
MLEPESFCASRPSAHDLLLDLTRAGGRVCQRGSVLILGYVGLSAHHFIDR